MGAFDFGGAGFGVEAAGAKIFLDDPEVEAGVDVVGEETAGGFAEELAANSLPDAGGSDVEIVEERAVGGMLVGKSAGEAGQLILDFGEDYEERNLVFFGEASLPESGALGVGAMVEIIVGEHAAIGGAPAFGVEMGDGGGVVLVGFAEECGRRWLRVRQFFAGSRREEKE